MVNGNSLAPDVEDGIPTTRGAYVENGQGFYLAPFEVSQFGFVFPESFTVILWIYPFGSTTNTLLKKGTFLELRLEPSLSEIHATYNGEIASIVNIAAIGNYYIDKWGLLSISHNTDSGSQTLKLFYNDSPGSIHTFSLAFADNYSQQLVLGSSQVASPFKGFIFHIIIYAEIIPDADYSAGSLFQVGTGGCVYPSIYSDCMSAEINLSEASCGTCPNSCDLLIACVECHSACNNFCTLPLVHLYCLDMTAVCTPVAFNSSSLRCEWPCIANCAACSNSFECDSCDPEFNLQPDLTCSTGCPSGYTSISRVCTPCHINCSECVGTTSSDCTACSDPNSSLSSDPVACSCNSGFYTSVSEPLLCSVCHFSCSECSGPLQNECLSCVDSLRVLTSGTCVCITGYFDTTTSCEQCHSDCETCDGDLSSNCLTCSDSIKAVNNGSCVCPLNYFLDSDLCVQCHSDCASCNGDLSSDCLTCSDSIKTVNNGSCVCPLNYFLDSGLCVQCHFDCSSCDGDLSSDCLTCSDPAKILDNGSCVCPLNYFLDLGLCVQCHSDCASCNGDLSSDCLTCSDPTKTIRNGSCICPPDAYFQSGTCVCETKYSMISNNGVYECFKCDDSCKECSGSTTFCVSCSVGNAVLKEEEGVCSCPENSEEVEGECVCEEGFSLKDAKCERKTEIDLNSFDSAESVVISSSIATASVSSILISDPSSMWMILNNLQILTYMPFHTLILPGKVERICNAFQLSSLLPNLSVYLFGDELNIEGLPEQWVEKGIERTHFLLNIGQVLLVVFGYFCYLLITLFLVCVKKDKFIKHLREFRYNIVLRLWVEMFLEVFVASVISLDQLFLQNYDYANLIGGAMFVVQIGSILWLWRKLYVIKNNFQETPNNVKNRYSSLFYEFDLDKSESSYFFYIYFMIRRATCILGLYYLSSTPLLQLMLSLNGSIIQILILLIDVKFKDKLNQAVTIAIEALFCVLYLLILYYNSDISDEAEEILDYLSVGVVGLMGLSVLMNQFVKIYRGLSGRCKSKQEKVVDESAIGGKYCEEESKVFALPQNRLQNKPHIALEINDLY